jgi:hypothetical protein
MLVQNEQAKMFDADDSLSILLSVAAMQAFGILFCLCDLCASVVNLFLIAVGL